MSDLQIVVGFDPARDLWMAAVLCGNEILTIGYEPTQDKAAEWGGKAAQARAWEGENKDPPDVYARALKREGG